MATTFTHPDLPRDAVVDALEHAGFEVAAPRPVTRVVARHLRRSAGRGRPAARAPARPRGRRSVLRDDTRCATGPARGRHRAPVALGASRRPLRSRLTEVTKERALLPLLADHLARAPARERRDRRGKATVVAELHDDVVADGDRVAGWLLELQEVDGPRRRARADHHPLLSLGLDGRGRRRRHGRRPRHRPARWRARRARPRFRSTPPSRRWPATGGCWPTSPTRSRRTGRAPSRTSTRSSCTTSGSRCGAPARCSRRARGCCPTTSATGTARRSGELGQQTGPARDLDVYVVGWDDYVAPLGLAGDPGLDKVRREIERRRAAAHARAVEGARERRVPEHARRVADVAGRPQRDDGAQPAPRPGGGQAHREGAGEGAHRRPGHHRRSPGERLHDLRKDTKKLRYLLECFGSLFPADDRKAFVSQLKDLQDNLGEHQDAEVHLAQLRDLAHDLHERSVVDTDALLAMGRLSDQLERRRSEERAAFAKRFAATTARRTARRSPRCSTRSARAEGRRDLQHQGRRREDDHRGEPRLRGRPRRRAGPGVGPRSAGSRHLPAPGAPEGARREPQARVGQGSAGRPRARHRPRRRARAPGRLLAPPPRRPPRGHPRAHRADRHASSSRCATTTTWRSSTARRASRWPARACSARPTRCSCRSSRPRSPAARSPS